MKSLLLDSNVLLYWLSADPRLERGAARARIESTPEVYLSVCSAWELWIKQASGKLSLPSDLDEQIARAGFQLISPTLQEARLAARLPLLHKDPFDRIIVAQAITRELTLVTTDVPLGAYGVDMIKV